MSGQQVGRRTVLKGIGAAIATGSVASTATASTTDWTIVETETDNTLHDVVSASAGRYAVGNSGVLLTQNGDLWEIVRQSGPTGNGNSLYGADVTDDGDRVWFVGSSGAIGEYVPATDTLYDHSSPNDNTNNYNGVAVTGPAGDANVYVAGDSGHIFYSFENGEAGTWDYVTPGSGSAIKAIDFHGPKSGHAIDGNGKVFATDDGVTWNVIGVEDANVSFYGVDSDAADDVTVSGGNGTLLDWDGSKWTVDQLGDKTFVDVEVSGTDGIAVGSSGTVHEIVDGVREALDTPTGQNLHAVIRDGTDVAVGASGTVIES
ncbi:MAG: hypothetical protein ABEH81_03200 [Halopenitus sp.]